MRRQINGLFKSEEGDFRKEKNSGNTESENTEIKNSENGNSKKGNALATLFGLFKNKRGIAVAFVAALAVLLLLSSEGTGEKTGTKSEVSVSAEEYTKNLEKKLEKLLSGIEGAGKVEVMISLESCYENVYLVENSEEEKREGDSSSLKKEEEYVTLKKGTGYEECVVVKVYEPKVKGVAVTAEGADSAAVKKALTDTVCAVFSVSSTRVSVEKLHTE